MTDAAAGEGAGGGRRSRTAARPGDTRVDHQPAFVLHATAWRETSQIVEVLTRDFGRIAVVARGAKRPTSQFRGLLAPFNPLAVSWSGRHEIKSLVRAEWLGGMAPLRGDGLLAAFYLNELLVRLLARADPHEALFAGYVAALGDLSHPTRPAAVVLRSFELDLLRETGHALPLDRCADGAAVVAGGSYRLDVQRGLLPMDNERNEPPLRGEMLLALARRDFRDPAVAREARDLLRRVIRYHLDGRPLNTRRILADLKQL